MSVDLDAERAASAERREEKDFHLWLGHRAGMLRTEGDVSLEAARKLWPSKGDDYLRQVVARAERDIQRGRKTLSDVWDGADMVERGAELFLENPEATSREVWKLLEEEANGRAPGITVTSWVNGGYATRARKLAEAGGPVTTPEPDPEPVEAVPATPEPAKPEPVEEPSEEWGRPPGLEEEADSILLELGGQRFEAWRSGDAWEVEFSGTMDTVGMQEIMGRVLEGVA